MPLIRAKNLYPPKNIKKRANLNSARFLLLINQSLPGRKGPPSFPSGRPSPRFNFNPLSGHKGRRARMRLAGAGGRIVFSQNCKIIKQANMLLTCIRLM